MNSRWLGLLGSSLLIVLATACGDDGNNSGGTCGDGHVTGSEMCDDGNKTGGDGCSSSCKVEGTCGNNVVEVNAGETCDDGNTAAGDGCSATCQSESGTCGNSQVEGSEQCDDGNTMAGDGCSATCMNEGSSGGTCAAPTTITLTAMGTDMVGTAMGDTNMGGNSIGEADCDGYPSGAGKDIVYKFTTTDVRDVMVVMTPDSGFDANIRLMSACSAASEIIDQVGGDGCSDYPGEGEYEILGYVNLPAGTYYVSVDGYDDTYAGTFDLEITASLPTCGDGHPGNLEFCDDGNMTDGDGCTHCTVDTGYNCDASEPSICQAEGCGDGIIQTDEDCDDDNTDPNDGCSATCTVESGYSCSGEPSVCAVIECGNGIVETGEECDDGNPTNGDRCSMTCLLESDVPEAAEPNNTAPQTLTAGSHIIRGTFEVSDIDLYTFTLSATSKVEIETYSSINGTNTDYEGVGNALLDCPDVNDDTVVAVFPSTADTTMDAMALAIDDDDGDDYCSYLGANDSAEDSLSDTADPTQLAALPAGTYTIRIRPYDSSIPAGTRYLLDLKITPMGTGPVVPAAGDLKINEFLAADGGTTNGGVDSNCDGSLTDSNDEFIELVNVSNKTLDLTGLTYEDSNANNGIEFTFTAQPTGSLTLAPNKAVVIWGGGTPNCTGVNNFFTAGTAHTLSLNDDGDTITIKTGGASPVTIATTTYAAGTIAKSLNLDPDITGTMYKLHNLVTNAVGNLSPGKKADGSAF
jgi:cysteine-rich repeat protein